MSDLKPQLAKCCSCGEMKNCWVLCADCWAKGQESPAPKVDMGPCGLSEEDERELKLLQDRVTTCCGDLADDELCGRCLNRVRVYRLVRRLPSSTPPDPSSAAKEEAERAVLTWVAMMPLEQMWSLSEDAQFKGEIIELQKRQARLAALD